MNVIEESEKFVLAGIIQYGAEAYYEVSDILETDAFSTARHAVIYNVFSNIFGENNPPKKVDYVTFLSTARALNLEHEITDNRNYLGALKQLPIEFDNLRRNAATIFKNATRLSLRTRAQQIIQNLDGMNGQESLDQIIACVENPIFNFIDNLNMEGSNIKLLGDGMREYINDLIGNPRESIGLPFFIEQYSNALGGGLRPGIDIISARSKVGKSVSLVSQARFIAETLNIPVLYLDMEMTKETAQTRMASNVSSVGSYFIEHGKIEPGSSQHTKIMKAITKVESAPIYYVNIAGKEFDEVVSIIRRWLLRYVKYGDNGKMNPCQICYDYIRLSQDGQLGGNMQEYQLIGFMAQKLANIGLQYGVNILSTIQSNRGGEVSMSDRVAWLCNSLGYLIKPEDTEYTASPHLGNRYLKLDRCRFGPGLAPEDFVAIEMDGATSSMKVLGLASKLGKAATPKQNDDSEVTF